MQKIVYLILSISLLASSAAIAAVPTSWQSTAYAYDADDVSLRAALNQFSEAMGVRLEIKGVSGTLKRKMRSDSASGFMDRLALEFKFQWFVYNGTLYISPQKENRLVRIEVSEDAIVDLKKALTEVGLLDERFGWGELPDEGVVIVSGPRKYVQLVQSLTKKKKKGDEKMDFMVFPLQYALVDDRRIKYRDQTVVIPGIASILSGLMSRGSTNSYITGEAAIDNSLQAMNQFSQSTLDGYLNRGAGVSSSIQGGYKANRDSKIRADTRNNAVLIYDDADKEPMYRSLINKLDVPRNLIEIDAIILDIDRSSISELGMRWQVGNDDGSAIFNTSGNDPFLANGTAATVSISDFRQFFAQIRALETRGNASMVANPSILTIENQLAVIDFNKTAYISSIGERVASVTPVTAGTSLQVVPRSINQGDERLIQLSLNIEDGGIEEVANSNPNVNRGSVSTQAVINVNQSLVVGGFNVEQKSDSISRIPVVGSVPVLGKLFSYKKANKSGRERLFIITPRLLGTELNPTQFAADENSDPMASVREVLATMRDNNQVVDDIVQIFKPTTEQSVTREKISQTIASLVNGAVPSGFTERFPQQKTSLSKVCKAEHMMFDDKKLQWFSNNHYALMIGVVRNTHKKERRFDEASCLSRDTLAVTVWPNPVLKPGEEAEVFVAMSIPNVTDLPERSSMLGE